VSGISQAYPFAKIILAGSNLGYSGGNNLGIYHALSTGATHILILNNDTVLDKDCVARLLYACESKPGTVAIAPKSLWYSQSDIIYFAGGRINSFCIPYHVGLNQADGPIYSNGEYTEWITGCALFVTRDGFEKIGLFDDRYFLLFEDIDWSVRARYFGYYLRYAPDAILWHKGSVSFGGKGSAKYQYYYVRNGLLWLESYNTLMRLPFFWLPFLRSAWGRADRLKNISDKKEPLRKATLFAVYDYLARRFGKGRY
jgi:GT2 family glycosyltransferase